MKKLFFFLSVFTFAASAEIGNNSNKTVIQRQSLLKQISVGQSIEEATAVCEANYENLKIDFIEYDYSGTNMSVENNIIFPGGLNKKTVCDSVISGQRISSITPQIITYSGGKAVTIDYSGFNLSINKPAVKKYKFISEKYNSETEYQRALNKLKKMKNIYILENNCNVSSDCKETFLIEYYRW